METSAGLATPTWTKFICTIGPASWDPATLEKLALAGASVFRYNFAHAEHDNYRKQRAIIQDINRRLGTKVVQQADLQGPNLRVGVLPEDGVPMEAGKEYLFYTTVETAPVASAFPINDATLHLDVKVGESITFMDGALQGEVTKIEGGYITVRMVNSETLKSRKSINVPDTDLSSPCITEKDWRDLELLLEAGVDILALSFLKGREEIDEVRQKIGDRPVKIVSKVERKEAIKNIREIVDASDSVMIARGDLGIELPMEEIPILQREIIALCQQAGKGVITATQMLLSMTKANRPTRAEVSDVANAVFAGSDALMLSEETTIGIDPVNTLETMVKIARRTEEYMHNQPNRFLP